MPTARYHSYREIVYSTPGAADGGWHQTDPDKSLEVNWNADNGLKVNSDNRENSNWNWGAVPRQCSAYLVDRSQPPSCWPIS